MLDQIEKQAIEEMAIVLSDGGCRKCDCDANGRFNCKLLYDAELLYNESYRKQEWISVDERLPEEDTIVLVWCGEVSVYNYLHNDLWYTGYCDITTSEGGVTHWMPLPEPPKMKGGAE